MVPVSQREKAAPRKVHKANEISHRPIEISDESKAKMAAAMAKEIEKITKMAEERRRRDPTFKPDAIDLDRSKMRKFNKFVDYYEVLGIEDRYIGSSGLKDAYKRLSLELHPDKQLRATEEERVAAEERFHAVQVAYDILQEPATRQAYDKARLKVEAQYEAGVVVTNDESTKPPPSCVDIEVPLAELFSGARKVQRYTRMMFAGTRWEKKTDDTYKLEVRPGELDGTTFWFKNEGDVTTGGKADLVFVLNQEEHKVGARLLALGCSRSAARARLLALGCSSNCRPPASLTCLRCVAGGPPTCPRGRPRESLTRLHGAHVCTQGVGARRRRLMVAHAR